MVHLSTRCPFIAQKILQSSVFVTSIQIEEIRNFFTLDGKALFMLFSGHIWLWSSIFNQKMIESPKHPAAFYHLFYIKFVCFYVLWLSTFPFCAGRTRRFWLFVTGWTAAALNCPFNHLNSAKYALLYSLLKLNMKIDKIFYIYFIFIIPVLFFIY
jgi:hypothetical protein